MALLCNLLCFLFFLGRGLALFFLSRGLDADGGVAVVGGGRGLRLIMGEQSDIAGYDVAAAVAAVDKARR